MSKKDIIIIIVIVILAIGLICLFLFLSQKEEKISLTNFAVSKNESVQNINLENTNIGINENVNISNTNIQKEEITFEKFFRVVYLAKFIGESNPPVATEFAKDDKIVMSVRVMEGLKTDLKMYPKIYKGDKLMTDSEPIEILDGEVGLNNPGKNGDYEVRLFVDETLVKTLTFKIK